MFYNNKSIRRMFFPVVCLSLLFIQNVNSEDSNPEPLQIETNRGHVVEINKSPRAMELEGEQIVIPARKALNSANNRTAINNDIDKYEPLEESPEIIEAIKDSKDKRFKGVSIANTSGQTISSAILQTEQVIMTRVRNLGKPMSVKAEAQPVKSGVKYSDSDKLLKLEEKRRKRKENFEKKLNQRTARKALVRNKKMK